MIGAKALWAALAVAALPAAALAAPSLEGNWRVAAIGDAAVPAAAGLTVTFAGGAIRGDTGCNRFSGSYSFAAERLDMGPLRATRRGCKGDAGRLETGFLRALGTAMKVEPSADGVVLSGPAGERLALVKA